MKAILEFDLPEEEGQYLMASSGSSYWSALWGFNEFIRRLARGKDFEFKPNQFEIVDYIFSRWLEETGDIDWDGIP